MATSDYVELTADIVSAYVSKNSIPASSLPELLGQVHSALSSLNKIEPVVAPEPLKPAVSVKKSVTADYIICLEDGLQFKSLKRHLRTKYGMTPEDYRTKWGLPNDYPMVAPSYAEARSTLARQMGLGQQRRQAAPPVPPPAPKRGKARKVTQAAEEIAAVNPVTTEE